MRTITEIIKDAGGAAVIAESSNDSITPDAVYKWQKIGIPDRHWPVVMPLAKATPEEMFKANIAAREASAA